MSNLKKYLTSIILLGIFSLASCQKGGELPPIPNDAVTNTDDLDSGNDSNNPSQPDISNPTDPTNPDDGNTDPTTPPGPQTAFTTILPSDVNPKSVVLVYRKSIDPLQLGEVTDSGSCHDSFKHKCVKNSQVLFGYDTTALNKDYPPELWEIDSVELEVSLYSIGLQKRSELFCIHNLKLCSGELNKDDDEDDKGKFDIKFIVKNPKFWTGDNDDHITNNIFTNLLRVNQIEDDLWIVRDHVFDVAKLYNLSIHGLRRLFRKTSFISFSISDDTFVEDPIVKIYMTKRLPVL